MLEKLFAMDSNEEVEQALSSGRKLLEGKFYDRAMVEFRKALDLDQEIAMPVIMDIYSQSSGDPSALISLGTNLLSFDQNNVELINLLANAYRKQESYEQAKKLYQRGLEVDPKNEFATYNLAATIAKTPYEDSNAVSAVKPFEEMTDFKLPALELAVESLQEIYQAAQPQPDAQTEGGPHEGGGPSFVDSILSEEEPDASETPEGAATPSEPEAEPLPATPKSAQTKGIDLQVLKQQVTEYAPEPERIPLYLLNLAIYCMQERDYETARALFEDLLKQDSHSADLRCFLLCAIAELRHPDKALELMSKLLQAQPNHRYGLVNYGILLRRQGKSSQARVIFFQLARLLEHSQGDYSLDRVINQGKEELEKGNKKKAGELLTPLVDELTEAPLLLQLSQLHLENKVYDEALQALKRAARLSPRLPEVIKARHQMHRVLAEEAENAISKDDLEKAEGLLEQALTIKRDKVSLKKMIVLYTKDENDKRVSELKKVLDEVETKERSKLIAEKVQDAEKRMAIGDAVQALKFYEEAINIEPRTELYKQMLAAAEKLGRPELAEKLTDWFHEQKEEWNRKRHEEEEPPEDA